jgi:SAM-dependent methyltransferase
VQPAGRTLPGERPVRHAVAGARAAAYTRVFGCGFAHQLVGADGESRRQSRQVIHCKPAFPRLQTAQGGHTDPRFARNVLKGQTALHAKLAKSPTHQHVDAVLCLHGKLFAIGSHRGQGGGMAMSEAEQAWEEHYGERDRVWSGRVNARLAELVEPMTPGRALDLGCGEGGDAIWLAEHGWRVTAVDISQTALNRAAAGATARGLADRIDFQPHDLNETFPDGVFELVSAQFLHSTVPLDRARLLRRAADAVAPGGTLMVVDHAAAPPWASKLDHHHHEFPTGDEVVASLNLDESQWDRVRVAAVERDALGPAGQRAVLTDNVMVLRRS